MDLERKFLMFSHIYLSSMALLTDPKCKIRLSFLYQAKKYRKNVSTEIKVRWKCAIQKRYINRFINFSISTFLTSPEFSYSLNGYFDENFTAFLLHSIQIAWNFYWFYALTCQFKYRRGHWCCCCQSKGSYHRSILFSSVFMNPLKQQF